MVAHLLLGLLPAVAITVTPFIRGMFYSILEDF